jgi:hypothetical protein
MKIVPENCINNELILECNMLRNSSLVFRRLAKREAVSRRQRTTQSLRTQYCLNERSIGVALIYAMSYCQLIVHYTRDKDVRD